MPPSCPSYSLHIFLTSISPTFLAIGPPSHPPYSLHHSTFSSPFHIFSWLFHFIILDIATPFPLIPPVTPFHWTPHSHSSLANSPSSPSTYSFFLPWSLHPPITAHPFLATSPPAYNASLLAYFCSQSQCVPPQQPPFHPQ